MTGHGDSAIGRALILTPSRGRGGGIERYVSTIEWAFTHQGVDFLRVDLGRSGPRGHAALLRQVRAQLDGNRAPARLVLAHRCLLPVAWLLARAGGVRGISVICHGSEVWGSRLGARGRIERRLMIGAAVRVVAVSAFTAGTLFGTGTPATVLPPGLSQKWFDALIAASVPRPAHRPGFTLVTAFRLAEWEEKGLPEIVAAIAMLRRPDVRLVVCGSGPPPPGLSQLIAGHPSCVLRAGLDDAELAAQYGRADLFVLATRTRAGPNPSGEGFGLVLLEAQIAGVPVVGPARGGGCDAYIEGVTGLTPAGETAGELAALLGEILTDPARLARMAERSAEWSRECFNPASYAARVVAKLL